MEGNRIIAGMKQKTLDGLKTIEMPKLQIAHDKRVLCDAGEWKDATEYFAGDYTSVVHHRGQTYYCKAPISPGLIVPVIFNNVTSNGQDNESVRAVAANSLTMSCYIDLYSTGDTSMAPSLFIDIVSGDRTLPIIFDPIADSVRINTDNFYPSIGWKTGRVRLDVEIMPTAATDTTSSLYVRIRDFTGNDILPRTLYHVPAIYVITSVKLRGAYGHYAISELLIATDSSTALPMPGADNNEYWGIFAQKGDTGEYIAPIFTGEWQTKKDYENVTGTYQIARRDGISYACKTTHTAPYVGPKDFEIYAHDSGNLSPNTKTYNYTDKAFRYMCDVNLRRVNDNPPISDSEDIIVQKRFNFTNEINSVFVNFYFNNGNSSTPGVARIAVDYQGTGAPASEAVITYDSFTNMLGTYRIIFDYNENQTKTLRILRLDTNQILYSKEILVGATESALNLASIVDYSIYADTYFFNEFIAIDIDYMSHTWQKIPGLENSDSYWEVLSDRGAPGLDGRIGYNGTDGRNGKSMRYRGNWVANTAYQNDDTYIDVVSIGYAAYICNKNHTSSSDFDADFTADKFVLLCGFDKSSPLNVPIYLKSTVEKNAEIRFIDQNNKNARIVYNGNTRCIEFRFD